MLGKTQINQPPQNEPCSKKNRTISILIPSTHIFHLLVV